MQLIHVLRAQSSVKIDSVSSLHLFIFKDILPAIMAVSPVGNEIQAHPFCLALLCKL